MRSHKATIPAGSAARGSVGKFAGIPLSPSDVIAFCELELEIKDVQSLLQLQKERQLILWLLWEEENYHEQLTLEEMEEDKERKMARQRIAKLMLQYRILTQQIERIKKQHKELAQKKRIFAFKLADYYETGKYNNVNTGELSFMGEDKTKATEYLAKATNTRYSQSGFFHTATFYKYSGLFNAARLFILRENNILKSFKKDFIPAFSKTLFPFAFLGFSYALELLFDIGILVKAFLNGKSVRDTFYKDDRPARMANALVWTVCNIVCFVISGGMINAAVNLVAFAFDIGNECYRARKELKKYENLLDKVTRKIKIIEDKINEESADCFVEKNELEKLRRVQAKLQDKIKAVKKKRYWVIACAAALFVGMVLVFFPPAFLPYAGIVGSIMAFTSGSVFLGLGKRVYEWGTQLKNRICSSAVKELKTVPNKLQFLKNVIMKVSAKHNASFSVQMAVLTKKEVQHLRVSLGLNKNDALWQQQLKIWLNNSMLTSRTILEDKKALPASIASSPVAVKVKDTFMHAKNSNTFFYQKSHSSFLQTLQDHVMHEQRLVRSI